MKRLFLPMTSLAFLPQRPQLRTFEKNIVREEGPTFPRLNDLVDPRTFELAEPPSEQERVRSNGFFFSLLGGSVEPLLADALEQEKKYDQRLLPLLQDLRDDKKKKTELTEEESTLLNEGTLGFLSQSKPREPASSPSPLQKKAESFDLEEDEGEEDNDSPFPDEANAAPYWWK